MIWNEAALVSAYFLSKRPKLNQPTNMDIQWPFGRADYAHSHYGPSGGILIFDTQDSNRKSHEIGESAINPSQSIICNCTVLVP